MQMRRSNLIIFVLFLLVAGGVVGAQFVLGRTGSTILNPAAPVNISVLYSSELSEWVKPSTDAFNGQNRKVGDRAVHVDLQKMEDGDVLHGVLIGTITPTVWIPASTTWVNLLNSQWREGHQADLI